MPSPAAGIDRLGDRCARRRHRQDPIPLAVSARSAARRRQRASGRGRSLLATYSASSAARISVAVLDAVLGEGRAANGDGDRERLLAAQRGTARGGPRRRCARPAVLAPVDAWSPAGPRRTPRRRSARTCRPRGSAPAPDAASSRSTASPRCVAVRVVDLLEVVEVEHQHGERPVEPGRALDLASRGSSTGSGSSTARSARRWWTAAAPRWCSCTLSTAMLAWPARVPQRVLVALVEGPPVDRGRRARARRRRCPCCAAARRARRPCRARSAPARAPAVRSRAGRARPRRTRRRGPGRPRRARRRPGPPARPRAGRARPRRAAGPARRRARHPARACRVTTAVSSTTSSRPSRSCVLVRVSPMRLQAVAAGPRGSAPARSCSAAARRSCWLNASQSRPTSPSSVGGAMRVSRSPCDDPLGRLGEVGERLAQPAGHDRHQGRRRPARRPAG